MPWLDNSQTQTEQKDVQGHSAGPLKTAECYTELVEDPRQNIETKSIESLRLPVSRMQCTVFLQHLCLLMSLLGRRFVSISCKAILLLH